jgi:hypothetical protein
LLDPPLHLAHGSQRDCDQGSAQAPDADAARGSKIWLTASTSRPRLASDLDAKRYLDQALSSSSRKKLRQHRNRLGRQGVLANAGIRDPDGVTRAVEQFLQLEAQGWKGRNGTALLSMRAMRRSHAPQFRCLPARDVW